MPRTRALKRKAADSFPSPSSESPNAPFTGTPVPKIILVMKPMPTDEPTTTPEPIAASTDSKKARAKKVAVKEPISYTLLIRISCGDKNIVEEPSMECLQKLESTFDYGKELQKQRAVVAVKLREIKAPQSALRLESRAEVVAEGRGNTAWRTTEEASNWLEVEKLVRGFAAMGRKQMRVSWTTTYGVPPPSLEEGGSDEMTS